MFLCNKNPFMLHNSRLTPELAAKLLIPEKLVNCRLGVRFACEMFYICLFSANWKQFAKIGLWAGVFFKKLQTTF